MSYFWRVKMLEPFSVNQNSNLPPYQRLKMTPKKKSKKDAVNMDLQKSFKENSNDETPFKNGATRKSSTMAGSCKGTGKEWAEPGRVLSPA